MSRSSFAHAHAHTRERSIRSILILQTHTLPRHSSQSIRWRAVPIYVSCRNGFGLVLTRRQWSADEWSGTFRMGYRVSTWQWNWISFVFWQKWLECVFNYAKTRLAIFAHLRTANNRERVECTRQEGAKMWTIFELTTLSSVALYTIHIAFSLRYKILAAIFAPADKQTREWSSVSSRTKQPKETTSLFIIIIILVYIPRRRRRRRRLCRAIAIRRKIAVFPHCRWHLFRFSLFWRERECVRECTSEWNFIYLFMLADTHVHNEKE